MFHLIRKRGFEMSVNVAQPVLSEQAASAVFALPETPTALSVPEQAASAALALPEVPAAPAMAHEPVNTPTTLGVTPRYVLQYNAISRAAKNLSTTAHKLTAMAMSLLPPDLSSLTAAFTFGDFRKALGYGDGGEQYRIFTLAGPSQPK